MADRSTPQDSPAGALATLDVALRDARAARTAHAEQRVRLAAIDGVRQQLERSLAAQGADAAEAAIDELLADLRRLELDRRRCVSALHAGAGLDAHYQQLLAEKRDQLVAHGRPIAGEIIALDAQCDTVSADSARLTDALQHAQDALQGIAWLTNALDSAQGWSLADIIVPMPLDAVFSLAKHGDMRAARDYSFYVRGALLALTDSVGRVLEQPTPSLELRHVRYNHERFPALLDLFAGGVFDARLDYQLQRWRSDVDQCRDSLKTLLAELFDGYDRAQRALAELHARREELILNT